MATDKIQTGLRLKPPVLAKITAIAEAESRSLNGQIEYIVQEYIKKYEAIHGTVEIKEDTQ